MSLVHRSLRLLRHVPTRGSAYGRQRLFGPSAEKLISNAALVRSKQEAAVLLVIQQRSCPPQPSTQVGEDCRADSLGVTDRPLTSPHILLGVGDRLSVERFRHSQWLPNLERRCSELVQIALVDDSIIVGGHIPSTYAAAVAIPSDRRRLESRQVRRPRRFRQHPRAAERYFPCLQHLVRPCPLLTVRRQRPPVRAYPGRSGVRRPHHADWRAGARNRAGTETTSRRSR